IVTMLPFAIALAGGVSAWYLWYDWRARRLASERLGLLIGAAVAADARREAPVRTVPAFPPRYRFVPPGVGVVVAAVLWRAAGLPTEVAGAVGLLAGVLTYLAEDYVADGRSGIIEAQLAAAIDLLVGSLRAGASLLAAFESALEETHAPLRPYF